jgi:hypothetical protein
MNPYSYAAYQAQLTGDEPVPYSLTAKAEVLLDAPDAEAEAEWAGEWDCADSDAYQARGEAGLEPEAGL